jgi:hypothetical protein
VTPHSRLSRAPGTTRCSKRRATCGDAAGDRKLDTTEEGERLLGRTAGQRLRRAAGDLADGGYVAFYSAATNLVAGDTNSAADAFVRGPLP